MPSTPLPTTESPRRVDRLLDEALRLRDLDLSQALWQACEAEALALKLDYHRGLALARLRRGEAIGLQGDGQPDLAPSLLRQAQFLFEDQGDLKGQAEAITALARLLTDRDALAEAHTLHHQALQLRRRAGDKAGEAASLAGLGWVHRCKGQYADALQYLFMALELIQGEARSGGSPVQIEVFRAIGVVLGELGDHTQAMSYLHQGLSMARQLPDRHGECAILTLLGERLVETGHGEEAISHLARARELARACGQGLDVARTLLALAQAQQVQGGLAPADELLGEALVLMQLMRHRRGEARVMLTQARNRLLAAQPQAALALLEHALALLQDLQADATAAQVHELMSQIHEQRGEPALALGHFKRFHALQAAVHGQDNQRRVRALLQRGALEQIQQDAEQERRRGDALAEALEAAQAADREKEVLLARLAQQSDLLRQLAREDGLTGLANRRWLDAQLHRERERARRHHHPLAVAMIDIDQFKTINERYSHRVGDEVLRRLGLLLRNALRICDLIGRYGGEEFLVVLVETPLSNAVLVCEKLRQRVEALELTDLHPELRSVTISIGLAGDLPDPVAEDPVELADAQLYRAKTSGRNRVCWSGEPRGGASGPFA